MTLEYSFNEETHQSFSAAIGNKGPEFRIKSTRHSDGSGLPGRGMGFGRGQLSVNYRNRGVYEKHQQDVKNDVKRSVLKPVPYVHNCCVQISMFVDVSYNFIEGKGRVGVVG